MLTKNTMIHEKGHEDIILHCKDLLEKDNSSLSEENRAVCTESGCTGRAVAFDFIKSAMIDKINALLIKEMEFNKNDKIKILKLYNKFNMMRKYRTDIDNSSKNRNLPKLMQTFIDLDVISYLHKVSFNFDKNIEKNVSKFYKLTEEYKKKLYNLEKETKNCPSIPNKKLKSNIAKINAYISQGYETYKFLLQQLVCIKAYIYVGNNPVNQKRPAIIRTATLLGSFASADLFIMARETILPTIGIIAREAGHTKCSAISIIKLTDIIQKCVDKGFFSQNFIESPEYEEFAEIFTDIMGFIFDSVNKTKSGKAAYIAVHLAEELLNNWLTKTNSSKRYTILSQKISRFDEITTQMACKLYHGNPKTLSTDAICQHPDVKIERPNLYNPQTNRYGILFNTDPILLDNRTFSTYYGIKSSQKLEEILNKNNFSMESGNSIHDCTIRITLGDIDEIIDKPLDALVNCNSDQLENIRLNEPLLNKILHPGNEVDYSDILIPEYKKQYESSFLN